MDKKNKKVTVTFAIHPDVKKALKRKKKYTCWVGEVVMEALGVRPSYEKSWSKPEPKRSKTSKTARPSRSRLAASRTR